MLDKIKGYKTLAFNVVMALLLVWRSLRPTDQVPDEATATSILDSLFNSLDALTVIGNIILRFRTTTPVGNPVGPPA